MTFHPFYIDNIIKKTIGLFFMFICLTLLMISNLYYPCETCLIYYLCCEMEMNIFLDILSNNSKY